VLLTKFPLGFIMNPLVLLLGILRLNMDFLFVGFILPVIEFIVIIEFVRTLTSSMGEPIDFIQVFRVI